ncbi:MAG: hypothetical protein GY696_10220 [Gammaproteobacteria bacterium]|nr:hypothetical protein [Gammaproteobacteria bacterium]
MSAFRHFYAACALEIHHTYYNNVIQKEHEYCLSPRIFHHLRIRWQTIKWDTIASCVRDPRIRNAEIRFLDDTFLTAADPVRIMEVNPIYRDELLNSLKLLAHMDRYLNPQND